MSFRIEFNSSVMSAVDTVCLSSSNLSVNKTAGDNDLRTSYVFSKIFFRDKGVSIDGFTINGLGLASYEDFFPTESVVSNLRLLGLGELSSADFTLRRLPRTRGVGPGE